MFAGFKAVGNNCVASFPIAGNDAMTILKYLGVWQEHRPILSKCRKQKGCGIVAGCAEFEAEPQMTVYYFLECNGTEDAFKARGLLLVPKNNEHQPCADAALIQLAELSVTEATRRGIELISV